MSLAVLWLMAFASASHDIAADGFYMLGLATHQQAAFVGVRSAFARITNILGQGGLVYLAGWLMQGGASPGEAWQSALLLLALLFLLLAAYHLVILPVPAQDQPQRVASLADFARDSLWVFAEFFRKPGIKTFIAFLLLYRFSESQLLKLAQPFLLDPAAQGGLGLSNQDVAVAYSFIGISALTAGGILGGLTISRFGLRRSLWPMLLAMNLPNVVYLAMALMLPQSLWTVSGALAIEQFGYGFGFTAYLMVMIMIADGQHKTAHYAICTGFMALGMMLPGMWSGWLQDQLGYANFFIWVLVATLPSFLITALIKVPPDFGKRVG